MDDNKEAVVTTLFLEKKLLTTEKVITSHEVHKRTEKFTTIEEVVKDTDEAQKRTDNITKIEDVDKDTEKLEYMKKRQWSQSLGRIQISLRVSLKYLQYDLILIMI